MVSPFDRPCVMKARRLLPALLLFSVGLARPSAHNVAPEPIVDALVRTDSDHLIVQLQLPVLALADANLPKSSDGSLAKDQIGPALVLVGRGIARDLELQQGDEVLPMPAITASLSPDNAVATVDLDYIVRSGRTDFSARFHTFRSGRQVIATQVRYVVDADTTRTFNVTGDPERIVFEPGAVQALQHFLARGTDLVLNGGDFFLFALCLIAPFRSTRALIGACMALLAGQWLTLAFSGLNVVTVTPVVLLGIQATAASTIAVAALQDLVNPQSRWLWPLAFVFGLANGVDIGTRFLSESSFAGSHVVLGLLACLAVVALGQVWIVAIVSSAAGLLRRQGQAAQWAVLAVSLFAGHAALDRLVDRGQALADSGSVTLDRFLLTLTLAWATTILCAGILDAILSARVDASPGPALADAGDGQ
jgi:hypothetical protein